MANEIAFSGSLSVFKPSVMQSADGLSVSGFLGSMSGNTIVRGILNVLTSATAIPLGGLTSLGWFALHNTDVVNFVTLRNGSGGADVLQLLAGEWAFGRLLSTSVPFMVANTAPCLCEFFIASL